MGPTTPPPMRPETQFEFEAVEEEAQTYMEMITEDHPDPLALHSLANLFDKPWCWCTEEADYSLVTKSLADVIRKNMRFYGLISSKFLSSHKYTISVQAAAARVLLACLYPLHLEDEVLEYITNWLSDDHLGNSCDDGFWKRRFGYIKCLDFHMLKTYLTGLLGLSLASGQEVKNDSAPDLAGKLMHYLRTRVLKASLSDDSLVLEVRGGERNLHKVVWNAYEKEKMLFKTPTYRLAEDLSFYEHVMPDNDTLAQQREIYCIQCLVELGQYGGVLKPVLQEKGVDVCLSLLKRYSEQTIESEVLRHVLKLIGALADFKKFAAMFVDGGGIQKLLSVPRNLETFFGLSSCLVTIGSLQDAMECICALPSHVISKFVELGLLLLRCPHDLAQKNAALFFRFTLVFRPVIEAYDELEGLPISLSLLHERMLGASSDPGEVTSSEIKIAYYTCAAFQEYFKSQLLLLIAKVCPDNRIQSLVCHVTSLRAGCVPLDISNKAMDAVFHHIQKDCMLGLALLCAKWPACQKFIDNNGHMIMLEFCQGQAVERYALSTIALRLLRMVTLVPYSRKSIINARLTNDRVGIAVILEASNGLGHKDPGIIQQALQVLINLVCPLEVTNIDAEKNVLYCTDSLSPTRQSEAKKQHNQTRYTDQGSPVHILLQSIAPDFTLGLAAQLKEEYRQAREAVRSNNGIKVLLQFLQTSVVLPPAILDRLRALACRVLLGLARDHLIADILTKLQVAKKLSEVIIDLGSHSPGNEKKWWHTELTHTVIELIAVLTNSGCASTLAATTDAATPMLKRIERDTIAAATSISYNNRELLLLIHEHLQTCGLTSSAATLIKEAQLTPLSSLSGSTSLGYHASVQRTLEPWPSGRTPGGFLKKRMLETNKEELHSRCDLAVSLKKQHLPSTDELQTRSCGLSSSSARLTKEAHLPPMPSLSALASPGYHASVQRTLEPWPSGRTPGGFLNNRMLKQTKKELHSGCGLAVSLKKQHLPSTGELQTH